jgi:hypothetical protein
MRAIVNAVCAKKMKQITMDDPMMNKKNDALYENAFNLHGQANDDG